MLGIQPQSNIKLLTRIPFNKFDNETMYFESITAQTNYFLSHVKVSFTNCTYIRNDIETNQYVSDIGRIAVQINADSIYDCNYIMFQNTGFSNKWFYGFIDKIEYKNNNTAIVQFTIDELQTWLINAVINPCYVLREHTNDDTIGNNILTEPIEIPRYVKDDTKENFYEFSESFLTTDWSVCISYTPNSDSSWGRLNDGIFSGTVNSVYSLSESSLTDIREKINEIIASSGTIVSITQFPSILLTPELTVYSVKTGNSLCGYTPANNKLFTYPYNMLALNYCGQQKSFKFEDFTYANGNKEFVPTFKVYSTFQNTPSTTFVPIDYRTSISMEGAFNVEDSFTFNNYPQCSWATDIYNSYIAQNGQTQSLKLMYNSIAGIIKIFSGLALTSGTGGAGGIAGVGLISGGASQILGSGVETISQQKTAENSPDNFNGTLTGNELIPSGKFGYSFSRYCVDMITARKIDSYFTRYGYATNEYKTPNLTGRENFNYVKTKNCRVTGNIPQESARRLETMFNNGVTLWHNTNADLFDYTMGNAII